MIEVDWEALDTEARRRRRRTRRLAELEMEAVLRNTDGLQKLLDISDAEWETAQLRDAEGSGEA